MRFLSRINKIEKAALRVPSAEQVAARQRAATMTDAELIEIVRGMPVNHPPFHLTENQIQRLTNRHDSTEALHAV